MFGYVKAYEPDLKVKEQVLYRAFYCGLCRAMGKCTGVCSKCTLSYDITLLSIIRCALVKDVIDVRRSRCVLHPFRGRPMLRTNESLRYSACASVILTYCKAIDDLHDERGGKKMRARMLKLWMHGAYRRASKRFPELARQTQELTARMSSLENTAEGSLDRLAALSGELMEVVFSCGLEGEEQSIARAFGKSLGKWLYIIDAVDDYADDVRKKRFNPLFSQDSVGSPDLAELQKLKIILLNILSDAEAALDLVIYPEGELGAMMMGIVDNVLHAGLAGATDKVLAKYYDGCPVELPEPDNLT